MKHYKKAYVYTMIIIGLMSSCSGVLNHTPEYAYTFNKKGIENKSLYYSNEFDAIESIDDIASYLESKLSYYHTEEDDKAGKLISRNPKEILESGYGNCVNYTVVWLNIAYVRFGIKANLIAYNKTRQEYTYNSRTLLRQEYANHAIVEHNTLLIEPQVRYTYIDNTTINIIIRLTFDEIFNEI